jgi:hypothetical protein
MQHLRVATYEIKKGTFRDVADLSREGMLATFKEQPGFVRYGLADLGDKSCLSISLWETHEQATAAVPIAATWVRENMADRVEIRSSYVGGLVFFEGMRQPV